MDTPNIGTLRTATPAVLDLQFDHSCRTGTKACDEHVLRTCVVVRLRHLTRGLALNMAAPRFGLASPVFTRL